MALKDKICSLMSVTVYW